MEPSFDIDPIVLKYVREESLSAEESILLQQWMSAAKGREAMLDRIRSGDKRTMAEVAAMFAAGMDLDLQKDELLERLEREGAFLAPDSSVPTLTTKPQPVGRGWRTWMVAASVILLLGAAAWLIFFHPSETIPAPAPTTTAVAPDLKPIGNKATLTLADGRKIVLDSTVNGILAAQGNMNVTERSAGELAYDRAKTSDETATASDEKQVALAYNSLSTPRAGQFTIRLPDGTKVRLNNASAIRYPIAFSGPNRTVEIAGEAFFEVAKDAARPFHVIVHRGTDAANITSLTSNAAPVADEGGAIEVLGTSFNVMAYSDEPAERTTLIDGSIRFTREGTGTLLHPAEQSVLDDNGVLHVIRKVNVAEVTAWKNGFFHFDHASLEETMRQLARWYDIDVKYQGQPAEQEFVGRIDRSLSLSAVLKGLENDQVHFKLEGRQLTVTR